MPSRCQGLVPGLACLRNWTQINLYFPKLSACLRCFITATGNELDGISESGSGAGVCINGELAVVAMAVAIAMVSLTGRVETEMGTESGSDHELATAPPLSRWYTEYGDTVPPFLSPAHMLPPGQHSFSVQERCLSCGGLRRGHSDEEKQIWAWEQGQRGPLTWERREAAKRHERYVNGGALHWGGRGWWRAGAHVAAGAGGCTSC